MIPLLHEIELRARLQILSYFSYASPPLCGAEVSPADVVSIFEKQSSPDQLGMAFAAIAEQNFHSQLGRTILAFHSDPSKIIPGFISYLSEKPEQLPLVCYLAIPAIYGFFLTSDFDPSIFAFFKEVLPCAHRAFKLACFHAYIGSSVVFIREFCTAFFSTLSAGGCKPTFGQLYNALKSTTRFFTDTQLKVIKLLASLSPRDFIDVFFLNFLARILRAWNNPNLILRGSEYSQSQMESLLRFIADDFDKRNRDSILTELLGSFSVSGLELWPFARSPYHFILSPREELLLAEIFSRSPATKDVAGPLEKLRTRPKSFRKPETSLEGAYFELYIRDLKSYFLIPMTHLQFPVRDIAKPSDNPEFATELRSIQGQCASLGLQPLPVIVKGNETTDTFQAKLVKAQLAAMEESFRQFVLSWYRAANGKREQDFETYASRLLAADQFRFINERLISVGSVFQRQFVRDLIDNNVPFERMIFYEQYVISELNSQLAIELSADFQICSPWKPKFMKALELSAGKEAKVKYVRISGFGAFDQLSLGDRLVVLDDLFRQIKKMYPDDVKKRFAVSCQMLSEANWNSLYESILIILAFLNANKGIHQTLVEKGVFASFLDAIKGDNLMGTLFGTSGADGVVFSMKEKLALKMLLGV